MIIFINEEVIFLLQAYQNIIKEENMKIYKRLFSYAPEGKHNGYIAVFFISFIGFF